MTNGETDEVVATEETTETKNEAEEVIDIDLNDPQTEEAAVKIQVSHKSLMHVCTIWKIRPLIKFLQ